jgi:3-oxoacyl-[acyl-carrier-protein] synthase II
METEVSKYVENKERGASRVSPLYVPMLISNIAAGHISIKYGLEGHGFAPVSACATSAHAIGEAYRAIKHGYADLMFAGGSEAAITPTSIAGFQNMTAMSPATDKNEGLLAFDRRRKGFVMGEGAGALVLENYDMAKKRGARIYGEVIGYSASFDAHHITAPEPSGKGAANAILGAIGDAKLDLGKVGYINAHGTGTPPNDKTETLAIKRVFGGLAYDMPISSTKGAVGHMLGAAGAVEAIFCLLALSGGLLPPTANLREGDPECDLDYIPLVARESKAECALSVSLGFGATNAALILKKGD